MNSDAIMKSVRKGGEIKTKSQSASNQSAANTVL